MNKAANVIRNYIFKQNEEIIRDSILCRYGRALILVHFFTALFWLNQGLSSIIKDLNQSVCWPFLPGCDRIKLFLQPAAEYYLSIYFLVTIALFCMALRRREIIWPGLLVLEFIKYFFTALDYRFMGNYHFIPHVISFYFLFFSQKRPWILFWIFTFYMAAASLKINFEWLNGAALSWKVPFDRSALLPWLAAVALLTELVAPQLLFFRSQNIRGLGLTLLVFFHIASYYWVGFFYPAVMFCVLSIVFWEVRENARTVFRRHEKNLLLPALLWLVFISFQIGALNNAQLSSLDGKKRLWSLNMFDALSTCHGFFIVELNGNYLEVPFINRDLAVRVKCDNIVFLEQGRKICQAQPNARVSAFLAARRTSDNTYLEIVREVNLCSK